MPTHILKRSAEFFLARAGPAQLALRFRNRSALILAYHNVIPDDMAPFGDRSLHLPLARFRAQLDSLSATHEVVDLRALHDGAASGRPRVAITFDDAYRGALMLGLPELARRGWPATVFVAPGLLGQSACWWDVLASVDGRLSDDVRTHALDALAGHSGAVLAWARRSGATLQEPPAVGGIGTADELRSAANLPGVTLGSHTASHPNLSRLSGVALERELVEPLGWLRERFTNVLPWLAAPYGMANDDTASQARRVGYDRLLLIAGGWVGPGPTPFVLPRLNIPVGLSRNGFALRACGLLRQ